MRHLLVPLLTAIALLAAGVSGLAAPLTGQVVSDTGQGLAARVEAYNPQTRESALAYTSPLGQFSFEAPTGTLQVWATHGPEWTIAEKTADTAQNRALSLVLRRLVDMPARGYYGMDLHMHSTFSDGKQSPAEVASACQAEGLQIAALTDHRQTEQQEAWLGQKTTEFLPLRGQETSTSLGHILGINVSGAVTTPDPMTPQGMLDIFRQIHTQGGFAVVAHPSVPGMAYQTPDIQEYDAVEIFNGSLPPYGPVFDMIQGRHFRGSQEGWRREP